MRVVTKLRWGQAAPEFELPSTEGRPISLRVPRARRCPRRLLLRLGGGIWTPELTGLGQAEGEFTRRGAVILGISGDSLIDA